MYRVDVENLSLEYFNILKRKETQLETIENIKYDDLDSIYHFALGIQDPRNDLNLLEISQLNKKLTNAKINYKENDEYILNLEKRKKVFLISLKDQVVGVLKNQINTAKNNLSASKRSNEVLIKYKKLLVISDRDKKTLSKLGDELRFYSLELAKNNTPWQLITKPNVQQRPVAPRKSRVLAIGLLVGLILGVLNSYFREKKSRIIFSNHLNYLNQRIS